MNKKLKLDAIQHAVTSLYIQFARIQNVSSSEIENIHNLLKAVFKQEIDQRNIVQYFQNLYSIRQATNLLKRYLNKKDKILLLFNLLSIVYFDLLYIDTSLYSQILDIFEKKSNSISLDPTLFITGNT